MALTEAERAKRFKVYKNGDGNFRGSLFTLNKKKTPTWDAFLDSVTVQARCNQAVRSIRTPTGGTPVRKLEDLEDNAAYVACTYGRFKKIPYTAIMESPRSKGTTPQLWQVKPVQHSRIQASGRIRKIPTDVITIFVYANGKVLEPARRVTLTHRMLRDWEMVLAQITDKVNLSTGAARRVYTIEGQLVTDPGQLRSAQQYVAVGADVGGFKKLEYGTQRPAFNNSPTIRRRHNILEPLGAPRRARHSRTSSDQTDGTRNLNQSMTSTGSSGDTDNTRRAAARSRPRNQPAKKKVEEDGVFHAKPVKHKRSSEKRREVDYDKDEGGVFKAKDARRETAGAQEVEETRDTKVDLPIDQVEAEEVKEENISQGDTDALIPSDKSLTKRPSDDKTGSRSADDVLDGSSLPSNKSIRKRASDSRASNHSQVSAVASVCLPSGTDLTANQQEQRKETANQKEHNK